MAIKKRRKLNIKNIIKIIISFVTVLTLFIYLLIPTPAATKKVSKAKPQHKADITDLSYYLDKNKDRYQTYKKNHPELNDEQIVTYVNMYLDYNFYEMCVTQDDPVSLNTIVNKYYRLDSSYAPADLIYINDGYTSNSDPAYKYRKHTMSMKVYDDFVTLRNACRERNISFYVVSGYRSTPEQEETYQHMVKTYDVSETDKTCSRPGHSEHTTGYACDVALDKYSFDDIVNHPDYQWFASILVDYGFIIRYPDGKDSLTGYSYEPWHLRYLGKDLAKKVTESGLTYDEYYARYITE